MHLSWQYTVEQVIGAIAKVLHNACAHPIIKTLGYPKMHILPGKNRSITRIFLINNKSNAIGCGITDDFNGVDNGKLLIGNNNHYYIVKQHKKYLISGLRKLNLYGFLIEFLVFCHHTSQIMVKMATNIHQTYLSGNAAFCCQVIFWTEDDGNHCCINDWTSNCVMTKWYQANICMHICMNEDALSRLWI